MKTKKFIDMNIGGGTTDICRTIKARYGNIGHAEYIPKHKAESSAVLEIDDGNDNEEETN